MPGISLLLPANSGEFRFQCESTHCTTGFIVTNLANVLIYKERASLNGFDDWMESLQPLGESDLCAEFRAKVRKAWNAELARVLAWHFRF